MVCASLRTWWGRFNTGRSFVLVVWAVMAMAFLLPATPPPLAANSSGAETPPSTSPVHQSTTIPPADSSEFGVATTSGHPPYQDKTEPTLLQRHNLSVCWGASSMHVQEALLAAHSLREIRVAVVDTGVDTASPLLSECVLEVVDIVDKSVVVDSCGHGTHIAGTIAAIAPNSEIIDVTVADNRGHCTSSDVAKGIRAAVSSGAAVINLSLEVEPSPELEAAVQSAWQSGAILIAAAGMPVPDSTTVSGSSTPAATPEGPCRPTMSPPVYPASYPNVVAVTGTNEDHELAPVCNRGTWVDVAAPGLKTFSEMPGGTHGYMTGTSTAAAHVSGLAALLCGLADDENRNGRVNDEVRLAIEATSRPLGIEGTGNGIVDAEAAVRYIQR